MPYFTNISQMVREIDYLSKAVFTDVGDALRDVIMEEFEQLVIETAQWTGTAAASWNVSIGGDSSVREQNKGLKKSEIAAMQLSKGHGTAVAVAMSHNAGALDRLSTMGVGKKGNTYGAIVVENNAESSDQAETGPLRAENAGAAGAGLRFEQRLANRSFEITRNRKI